MDEVVGTFHFWDSFRMELLEHLWMNMVYNMVKMTASHVFPVFRHVFRTVFRLGRRSQSSPGWIGSSDGTEQTASPLCSAQSACATWRSAGRRVTGWRDAAGWWK